jgi:uncharacterized protein (TIGR03437 family)
MNEEVVLDRLRITIFAAVLMGLICVPMARAQSAANITILSGNGQIVCETCPNSRSSFFLPLVVRVTDGSGKPIPNKTVNWVVPFFQGQIARLNSDTTQTDAKGITSNIVAQTAGAGSLALTFLQLTVQASADNAVATFTETQALSDIVLNLLTLVRVGVSSPAQFTTLTGTAGATGTTPVLVHVDGFDGTPVPGASVRLLNANDPAVGASAACQTAAGADPGSVLTDAHGNASCTPVFGGIAGRGSFSVLVGGVDVTPFSGTTTPVAFFQSFNIPIVTTPPVPGAIFTTAGIGQSANPGQTLASPLTVRVVDVTGATISGIAVNWTVLPAGAATVTPVTGPTDSQGLASTTVTLSSLASGQVTVKAALTGANSNIATTFNINVVIVVTLAGVTQVTGDGQNAIAGAPFSQPLVVQVNTTAGVPANIPITFSVFGPATIGGRSSTIINTDSTGRAQVAVTAGSTAGTVTVTASAGAFSTSFTLAVVPPGPSLTADSFFNAAGLKPGSMSPCSLVTISAPGLAPGVQGALNPPSLFGDLPLSLGPVSVTFNSVPAPILRVTNNGGQEQVTVQVPCDVSPGSSVPVTANAAGGTSTVNVAIQPASPGIFETVMSDGVSRAVMVRPDGSFVSLTNPARRAGGGEIIRVYVTGLGPTAPAVDTNHIPIPGTDSLVLGTVIVGVDNSGVRVVSARAAPTQIGVYEVAFQIDPNVPVGDNIVLSVDLNPLDGSPTQFSKGSKIPIQ